MLNLDNIRAEMAKNKISGLDLAKKLNISHTSIYQKLNGKRKFTADEIGIIAKILKTDINFFYNHCC